MLILSRTGIAPVTNVRSKLAFWSFNSATGGDEAFKLVSSSLSVTSNSELHFDQSLNFGGTTAVTGLSDWQRC